MRHLIDVTDLSVAELQQLCDTALDIRDNPAKYAEACRGRQLATLFFEPSTRTRFSFESAMFALGGQVLSLTGAGNSSAAKGESIADTARTIGCYADIIAIRHPSEGAALVSAMHAGIPVINAGDGGHCHPTQTLADLLTIYCHKGGFSNLTVGLVGDLKYGRTVHSLIAALSRYSGIRFVLISPEELRLPDYVKDGVIRRNGMDFTETTSLENAIGEVDILYMTRIQRERFDDPDAYERLKDSYILTPEIMALAKSDCCVLHPLPRVNEISVRVDSDPRACYFEQVKNGKLMRMALILKLLSERDTAGEQIGETVEGLHCTNPKCVCCRERELAPFFKKAEENGRYRCLYCEQLV